MHFFGKTHVPLPFTALQVPERTVLPDTSPYQTNDGRHVKLATVPITTPDGAFPVANVTLPVMFEVGHCTARCSVQHYAMHSVSSSTVK